MRFSHEGYDTNCLLGYDAVSHDTNLERGGRQIPAWCDLPDDRNYEASLCQLAFCFVTRYILWWGINFFSVLLHPNLGAGRLIVEVPRSHSSRHTHTHTHTHTQSKTSLNEWSVSRGGRCLQNTQQRQKTNSQTLSGVRTRNPSKWAAADPRLRQPATGISKGQR